MIPCISRYQMSPELLDSILLSDTKSHRPSQSHPDGSLLESESSNMIRRDTHRKERCNESARSSKIHKQSNSDTIQNSEEDEVAALRLQIERVERERDQWKNDYEHLANILMACTDYKNKVESQEKSKRSAAKKRRVVTR